MLEKNSLKKCEKTIYYIYTNIMTENGGKISVKQGFQKHTNSASKKWGKKSSEYVRKIVFYIHMNIVT